MVDQRALPYELVWIRTEDWREVVDAICTLAVRGAPALGIAGAAAVMLAAFELTDEGEGRVPGNVDAGRGCAPDGGDWCAPDYGGSSVNRSGDAAVQKESAPDSDFALRLRQVADEVAKARPTAVNLSWGVRRAMEVAFEALGGGRTPVEAAWALYDLTEALIAEDEAVNRAIGRNGAAHLRVLAARKGRALRVLTHCNAGSLATAFYGTALGVVYAAAEEDLIERVYADETRPVGQGARLTSWELARAGIPVTLICDNMAATLMAQGLVDAVVVGADRVTANGDAANKIGTLGVAVLAHHFGIPFFVAVPTSTIDETMATGAEIPIEQRDGAEVLPRPIPGVEVYNPAFDVTPAELITALITEA